MRTKKIGQRVKILDGMKEFVGKTGTIIDMEQYSRSEPPYYRVKLDNPVDCGVAGMVEDDLWQGQYLQNIRTQHDASR